MTDRKIPGATFWATVALIVIVLYVASFGPACWIALRNSSDVQHKTLAAIYWPMFRLMCGRSSVGSALFGYAVAGLPRSFSRMTITPNSDGIGIAVQCHFDP